MNEAQELATVIERDGFAIVPDVIDEATISHLLSALKQAKEFETARRRGAPNGGGVRNLLTVVPEIRELVGASAIRPLMAQVLGETCFIVRSILFDKTPEANWKVAWHQDLSIAVRARRDLEGFSAWSVKAGVAHVQPPVEILERMLTLRLQLDAGDEANAPLRVIPGSHARGRLDAAAIARTRENSKAVSCLVPRGGALLMRPLLLHASSAARVPGHRRIIHLEFAAAPLPGGLEWSQNANE